MFNLLKMSIFTLLLTQSLNSQIRPFPFVNYGINDGISNSAILSIHQDRLGYLWFTSEDGLNRFDGYNFKVYRHIIDDSSSLFQSWTNLIIEDKTRELWFFHQFAGVSKYNFETDSFKRLKFEDSEKTKSIIYDKEKNVIWFLTNKSFYSIDCSNNSHKLIVKSEEKEFIVAALSDEKIYIILSNQLESVLAINKHTLDKEQLTVDFSKYNIHPYPDIIISNNKLFIGTNKGIGVFDLETKTTTLLSGLNTINNGYVSIVSDYYHFKEIDRILWISVKDVGLFKVNSINLNDIVQYKRDDNLPLKYYISSDLWLHPTKDNYNDLWSTSFYGLNFYDKDLDRFVAYFRYDNTHSRSLSNLFYNVFADKSGNIWASTAHGGVNLIPKRKDFKDIFWLYDRFIKDINMTQGTYFANLEIIKKHLFEQSMRDMLEDNEGDLWFATQFSVVRFVKKTGNVVAYEYNNRPGSLWGKSPGDILEDKAGRIWIIPYGGDICYIDKKNNMVHRIETNDVIAMKGFFAYAGYIDKKNKLWIGTTNKTINYFSDANRFKYFDNDTILRNQSVRAFFEDKFDNLWIVAGDKLIKLKKGEEVFSEIILQPEERNGLNFDLLSIAVDKNENFWLGSYGGGLIYYDRKTGKIKNFRVTHGLSNDFILEVIFDKMGHLWISTNKGINRLNPETGNIERFSEVDGLISKEFNSGAALLTKSGIMIFGGVNGITAFYPGKIKKSQNYNDVVFTQFSKYNKEFHLTPSISVAKKIELNYDEKLISFEFSSFSFGNTDSINYAYKIDGLDDDWIFNGNKNSIYLSNLEPGNYNLIIASSNSDGVWNWESASLSIIIHPPFWQTWWFKVLISLIVFTLIFLAFRYRIEGIKEKSRIEIETKERIIRREREIKEQISQDLHDEVNSELAVISGYCKTLLKEISLDPKQKDILKLVKETSQKAKEMIKEVIWFTSPENDSPMKIKKKIEASVKDLLHNKNCKLEIDEIAFENVNQPSNFNKEIFKIVKEIAHNIEMHSEANNSFLYIKKSNSFFYLVFEDDGKGFVFEELEFGNGLLNIQSRAAKLQGEILIDSCPNKGTKISLNIDLNKYSGGVNVKEN